MIVVISAIFVPATKDRDIFAADSAPQPGAK